LLFFPLPPDLCDLWLPGVRSFLSFFPSFFALLLGVRSSSFPEPGFRFTLSNPDDGVFPPFNALPQSPTSPSIAYRSKPVSCEYVARVFVKCGRERRRASEKKPEIPRRERLGKNAAV
jgi:hypothetical protein